MTSPDLSSSPLSSSPLESGSITPLSKLKSITSKDKQIDDCAQNALPKGENAVILKTSELNVTVDPLEKELVSTIRDVLVGHLASNNFWKKIEPLITSSSNKNLIKALTPEDKNFLESYYKGLLTHTEGSSYCQSRIAHYAELSSDPEVKRDKEEASRDPDGSRELSVWGVRDLSEPVGKILKIITKLAKKEVALKPQDMASELTPNEKAVLDKYETGIRQPFSTLQHFFFLQEELKSLTLDRVSPLRQQFIKLEIEKIDKENQNYPFVNLQNKIYEYYQNIDDSVKKQSMEKEIRTLVITLVINPLLGKLLHEQDIKLLRENILKTDKENPLLDIANFISSNFKKTNPN